MLGNDLTYQKSSELDTCAGQGKLYEGNPLCTMKINYFCRMCCKIIKTSALVEVMKQPILFR